MKSLIRFEDTYGIADIFCKAHNIKYIDIRKTNNIIELDKNTFIETGKSILGCFNFNVLALTYIIIRGIERVIFVFDLDNEDGIKTQLLHYEIIKKKVEIAKKQFIDAGYNIEFQFIPIVYSAETILLYQHISNRFKETSIESLVHDEDTNKFHLILLAILNKLGDYTSAKRVRDFLNIDKLKDGIQLSLNVNDNNINKHTLEWILDGCSLDYEHYSIKEVEDIINKATSLFMENRDKKLELYIRDKLIDTNISFNKLIDILGPEDKK